MRKKLQKLFSSALFLLLFAVVSMAQAPNMFNYQAVVRNASGEVIAGTEVSLRLSIIKGGAFGTPVFVETHKPTTNAFGLVSLAVGSGTAVVGNISSVDWGSDTHFLKVEMDATGGSTYTELGVSQILSVPYSMHAKESQILKGSITESQISDLKNYLTTETDPVFNTSPAQGITGSSITDWNTAFGWGNHAGLYRLISWVPSWMDVTDKPSVFPPSVHSHSAADITSGTLDAARIPILDIGTKTSGTLAVARGGTGATTFTSGNVLIGNGTGAITTLSRSGIDTRATFPPATHAHSAMDITTGTLAVARGGTGLASYTAGNYIRASGATTLEQRSPAQVRTDIGAGTVSSIATGNGITGGTITTTGTLGLTGQALALHNLGTNGIIARTGAGTVAARTITAGTGITVTNGNGVSGNPTIAAKTYAIGDLAHGGIVFYVEPCGTKGLVAATTDQSTGIKWMGGAVSYSTMARGLELYAGKMNTSIIIAVHSAKDDFDDHAALVCANYTGGDFGDWYLPSREELLLMYHNLHTQGLGNFSDTWYWSSLESSAINAWSVGFTGGAYGNNKVSTGYVRAVRAF